MEAGKIPRHERRKFPEKRKKTPRAEEETVTLYADRALTDAEIPLQKKNNLPSATMGEKVRSRKKVSYRRGNPGEKDPQIL